MTLFAAPRVGFVVKTLNFVQILYSVDLFILADGTEGGESEAEAGKFW
jgi:hypothetical protein